MGFFAKKTLTGYKEIAGEYARLEADCYIESMEEFQLNETKLRAAEDEVYKTKVDAKKQIEEAYASAKEKIKEYKEEVNKKIEVAIEAQNLAEDSLNKAMERICQLEDELTRERDLNSNLKRIARERANQDRKITPKKKHDGYIVMNSRQWTDKYEYTYTDEEYDACSIMFKMKHSKPYTERGKAAVWKSIIQTPYAASIPLEQIRRLVEDHDLWDGGILRDLGCPCMVQNDKNGRYNRFRDDEGTEENGLYKWNFVANYVTGFWELEIFTTKSLIVPEHRRPRPLAKKVYK